MSNKKIDSYKFGYFAEYVSIIYLFFKGYITISHRYRTKSGEVDIIVRSLFSKTIVFIEVKARKNREHDEVLSDSQKKRICKSASFFIATNPKYSEFVIRFDLIIFNNIISLKHIKNAWFSNEF